MANAPGPKETSRQEPMATMEELQRSTAPHRKSFVRTTMSCILQIGPLLKTNKVTEVLKGKLMTLFCLPFQGDHKKAKT